jgi:hypothetical protein
MTGRRCRTARAGLLVIRSKHDDDGRLYRDRVVGLWQTGVRRR